MSKDVDDLARVLRSLSRATGPQDSEVAERVRCLAKVVAQMGETLALHEELLTEMREVVAVLARDRA